MSLNNRRVTEVNLPPLVVPCSPSRATARSRPPSHLRSSEGKSPPEYGARISHFHNASRIFCTSSAPSPSTSWGCIRPLFPSSRRLQASIRRMLVAIGGDPHDTVMHRPVRSPSYVLTAARTQGSTSRAACRLPRWRSLLPAPGIAGPAARMPSGPAPTTSRAGGATTGSLDGSSSPSCARSVSA
jgi:hypothetical protein